ncbi:MAG TPA: hypothetical protein VGN33_09295, partial [Leifsonia sp.]|nr:hypothetical protein [Leifsonia sp.]
MADAETIELEQGPPHAERHLSPTTGSPVFVFCECRIGRDHTYGEWVALVGPLPAPARPQSRHRERYIHETTGDRVDLPCDCPIGSNHTVDAWIARYGRQQMLDLP